MMERIYLIAVALIGVGLFYSLRWSLAWVRLLARKFRRGVPYLWGSAGRAFTLLVPSLAVLLSGLILAATGYGMQRFQPVGDMVQVGTLEVEEVPGGGLRVDLRADPEYPLLPPPPQTAAATGRWSVSGQFILWRPAMHWLGLRDSHRVAWFLSVDDPSAIPHNDRINRRPLLRSEPWPLWRLLDAWDRYLPMVETREFQSPWQPGGNGAVDLFAYSGGYLLIHPEEEADR